jgi:crossover junction endodeoxyribonuclease RuvC
MRVLGIDPGTATVGVGIVDEAADGSLTAVYYGVIRTPSDLPMPQRLDAIYESITALIARFQPDVGAVEELFFAKNVTTAITVAQGRGVVLLALQRARLPVYEYKPNIVKQTVSQYGGAGKAQMQEMVRILLNLDDIPKPDDAADGLAIAIAHIQHSPYLSP